MNGIHKSLIFLLLFTFSACSVPKNNEKRKKKTIKSKTTITNQPNKQTIKTPRKVTSRLQKPQIAIMNLGGIIKETASSSPFDTKAVPFYKIIKILKKINNNKNIKALLIHLKSPAMSLELMWEMRSFLSKMKKNGKKIFIYADSLSTADYYLASVADIIGLNPAGSWEVFGFMIETVFLKDFLTYLGVKADFIHIGKYKSAAENITRNNMSPEFKTSLNDLLNSFYEELTSKISKSRKIDRKTLDNLISSAPLTPEEALKNKLIDEISVFSGNGFYEKYTKGYKIKKIGKKKKKKESLLQILSAAAKPPEVEEDHLALIIADGSIVYGSKGPNNAFSSKSVIASSNIIKILEKIRKNNYVKGVILRINSPGGSALASELIWAEIHKLNKVKPVYISMGYFAASGGYYMSCAGSKIFLSPFTVTGSIGVIGGKLVFNKTLNKFKIHTERLFKGANAALYSSMSEFSNSERKAILKSMEKTYSLFKQRVFSGRKNKIKSLDTLEKIAQGRIWMGKSAVKNGLADKEATLLQVSNILKKELKMSPDSLVVLYPRPKPWLVEFSEMMESGSGDFDDVILSRIIKKANISVKGVSTFIQMLNKEHVFTFMPVFINIK